MKIIKEEGGNSIMVIAQTEDEKRFVYQLQTGVTVMRCDLGDQVRLRILPDITALVQPKTQEYNSMSVDDLSTKAATMGIDVQRNAHRDDLIKVLEMAKTDLETAKEASKKIRQAAQPKPFQLTPGGRSGDIGVNTVNTTKM